MANITAEIHMRDETRCNARLFSPQQGNSELTFVSVAINSDLAAITRVVLYFTSEEQIDELLNALVDGRRLLTGKQHVIIERPAEAETGCI